MAEELRFSRVTFDRVILDERSLMLQTGPVAKTTIPREAVETVVVVPAGLGSAELRVVGRGTTLAAVRWPVDWSERAQAWILARLRPPESGVAGATAAPTPTPEPVAPPAAAGTPPATPPAPAAAATQGTAPQLTRQKRRNIRLWVGGVLVGLAIIGALTDDGQSPAQSTQGRTSGTVQQTGSEKQVAQAPQQEPAQAGDDAGEEASQPQEQPFTPEERAYALQMMDHLHSFSETMTGLGLHFQQPDLLNDEWRVKAAAYLAQIELLVEASQDIEVPESLVEIHAKYEAAMKRMAKVPDLMSRGIDSMDPELIERATAEILEANDLLNEYNAAILAWQQERQAGGGE